MNASVFSSNIKFCLFFIIFIIPPPTPNPPPNPPAFRDNKLDGMPCSLATDFAHLTHPSYGGTMGVIMGKGGDGTEHLFSMLVTADNESQTSCTLLYDLSAFVLPKLDNDMFYLNGDRMRGQGLALKRSKLAKMRQRSCTWHIAQQNLSGKKRATPAEVSLWWKVQKAETVADHLIAEKEFLAGSKRTVGVNTCAQLQITMV